MLWIEVVLVCPVAGSNDHRTQNVEYVFSDYRTKASLTREDEVSGFPGCCKLGVNASYKKIQSGPLLASLRLPKP